MVMSGQSRDSASANVDGVVEAEVVAELPGVCTEGPVVLVPAMDRMLGEAACRCRPSPVELTAKGHPTQHVADLGINKERCVAALIT